MLPVIFTAHSVPQQTVIEGDPYETQAQQTAELVAAAAGLERIEWRFAFQSQGMSGGAWLGPTVEATILDLKRSGHRGVFVQPIGFLCDHVEILYDIDVIFKQFAEKEEMRMWRAESLNDSPLLTAALAEIAHVSIAEHARNAMKRVAIVGGGISGLAAAFALEKRKKAGAAVEYVLFESSARFGGVIRTESVDGCVVEAGPDSFLTEKPWAAELCRELGTGRSTDRIERRRPKNLHPG